MLRILWVFLALTPFACAQSNFATISGMVEDASHKTIDGASITLHAKDTEATRTLSSKNGGLFEVVNLPPGEYSVDAEAPGFARTTRTVTLEVAQNMGLDLVLSVGEQHTSVSVTGSPETLKTQDSSLGEVVEPKSIEDLPLNGRMLLDLALTVPGAHAGHGAQTGTMNPLYWRPGQASAITIGGNRPNANYFLLDGVTNTDPTFNTQNISPSPDAVREFQVQVGSYKAEMGGAGGGQVNIITKAGTSQFHGSVYEYMRNSSLDARTWNEMPGTTYLVQNNGGASLGGPVYGKKTFFFANYEDYHQTQAQTMTGTVPTAIEDGGDFSQSGVAIYDPSNSHANPNYNPALPVSTANPQVIRSQFAGNTIPLSRLNAAAVKMLQNYTPLPNQDNMMGMTMMGVPTVLGVSGGQDSNNLLDVRDSRQIAQQGTIRADRMFDGSDSVNVRYSVSGEHGFTPQNLPGYGFYHNNLGQNGAIVWNHVISSTMVDTASINVSRLAMDHFTQDTGVNDIVSALGITGVGFGGSLGWGAPSFNVQGYSPLGDAWLATPMHMWDTILEGRNTLSWQKGRHTIKFGGSYRWYVWPMQALVQSRGYYTFTTGFTTQTATNDGTGDALASFLLGLPATRQVQNGLPTMDLRQWQIDSFVQDTWRATPHTTIDVGVRYEFMAPLADTSRNWSNMYQQGDGSLVAFIGGQNGTPRGLMYPNKLRFAPRLGLSHHIESVGIVFHTAYGIFYTPVDLNTWCNQLHNVPLVFPITQQSDNFTPSLTGFNFPSPVLGSTVTSFTAFDPHAPSQYVEQWSASIEKSLGKSTTLEIGYHGERGKHLQEAVLINNDQPGPGTLQPRRPHPTATFLAGTVFPASVATTGGLTIPVSTVNMLEDRANSWYDAGYINLRRRYSSGLTLLANYTYAKNLSDAPDFRSPMFESSVAQNAYNLNADKGPACDIRHRFVVNAVYDIHPIRGNRFETMLTRDWRVSTLYQIQSGFPFTISVYGDTANAGTVVGENPIRANYTGAAVFGAGTGTTDAWFNPGAFSTPAAYTFGNVGRNTVYGPGMQTMDLSLTRSIPIADRARIELRVEAFNSLNHSNWGTPNRFVNTPQFGSITEAATPGREFQLSGRVSF
jgi:hypothetical protein